MKPVLPVIPGLERIDAAHHANVRALGASGDGRADDAPAIQRAIDSLPGKGQTPRGGVVFVPAGEYRIGKTILVPEQVSLLGEHVTAALLRGARGLDGPLLRIHGDYTCVENLTIDAAGQCLVWSGGIGSSATGLVISGGGCPLTLTAGCHGLFSSLDLKGGNPSIDGRRPGSVSFVGLSIRAVGGVRISGGGPVTVHGLHYQGTGRAVEALAGARVAVIGCLAEDAGSVEGVLCDETSLLYASALSCPGRKTALVDRSGEGVELDRARVGLYTGQATVIPGERDKA